MSDGEKIKYGSAIHGPAWARKSGSELVIGPAIRESPPTCFRLRLNTVLGCPEVLPTSKNLTQSQ